MSPKETRESERDSRKASLLAKIRHNDKFHIGALRRKIGTQQRQQHALKRKSKKN